MTLLQQKLIANIPTSKTVREAATKAGYSDNSREMYRPSIQNLTKEYISNLTISPESIIEDFANIKQKCIKRGRDYTIANGIKCISQMAELKGYYPANKNINVNLNLNSEELSVLHKYLPANELEQYQDKSSPSNPNHK